MQSRGVRFKSLAQFRWLPNLEVERQTRELAREPVNVVDLGAQEHVFAGPLEHAGGGK